MLWRQGWVPEPERRSLNPAQRSILLRSPYKVVVYYRLGFKASLPSDHRHRDTTTLLELPPISDVDIDYFVRSTVDTDEMIVVVPPRLAKATAAPLLADARR